MTIQSHAVDLTSERVLILDPDAHRAQGLVQLLDHLNVADLCKCSTPAEALAAAGAFDPSTLLVSYDLAGSDGLEFTRALRRSALACRGAPLVLLLDRASPAILDEARNAGVHEFMVRPFTFNELSRRMRAASSRARDWVERLDYVGPDRRQFNASERGWQTR